MPPAGRRTSTRQKTANRVSRAPARPTGTTTPAPAGGRGRRLRGGCTPRGRPRGREGGGGDHDRHRRQRADVTARRAAPGTTTGTGSAPPAPPGLSSSGRPRGPRPGEAPPRRPTSPWQMFPVAEWRGRRRRASPAAGRAGARPGRLLQVHGEREVGDLGEENIQLPPGGEQPAGRIPGWRGSSVRARWTSSCTRLVFSAHSLRKRFPPIGARQRLRRKRKAPALRPRPCPQPRGPARSVPVSRARCSGRTRMSTSPAAASIRPHIQSLARKPGKGRRRNWPGCCRTACPGGRSARRPPPTRRTCSRPGGKVEPRPAGTPPPRRCGRLQRHRRTHRPATVEAGARRVNGDEVASDLVDAGWGASWSWSSPNRPVGSRTSSRRLGLRGRVRRRPAGRGGPHRRPAQRRGGRWRGGQVAGGEEVEGVLGRPCGRRAAAAPAPGPRRRPPSLPPGGGPVERRPAPVPRGQSLHPASAVARNAMSRAASTRRATSRTS